MKAIAYTALHYGKDYLASAIRSVIESVDEFWCLYTAIGSHGSRTDVPCPDTKDELYQIAKDAAGSKLRWRQSEWAWEGQQRDSIHQYVPDADVILTVDADEVWSEHLAHNIIESYQAIKTNPTLFDTWQFKRLRAPMVHAWRSFNRWIIHDPAFPERVLFPHDGQITDTIQPHYGRIFHFGYAQRPEIVEYKQLTHGHRSEWRKDDWFNTIFMANAQTDCHPVGSEWWNPEPVDPFALGLPEWMREHKYADMEVIGEVVNDACPRCGSTKRVVEEYGDFNSYTCIDCGKEYTIEDEVIE